MLINASQVKCIFGVLASVSDLDHSVSHMLRGQDIHFMGEDIKFQ